MTSQVVSGTHVSFGSIYDYIGDPASSTADLISPYVNTRSRDDKSPYYGSALVRTSVVPIPPAVWLFGSGFIGLIGLARRKA